MFARALLPLALVVALVGTASAEKAKLAVLGLEVAGSIDTDSTSHGRLLTERLRARIGISQRFMLAPNSLKDLLDEKVANNCDTEAPACMSMIAGKLKAAWLVYGKIEKRKKDDKEGYQISIKALDVDKKVVKDWGEWLPLASFLDPAALDGNVTQAYDILLPKDEAGTVITGPGPGPGPTGPTPQPKPSNGGGGFPWKTTAYASTAVTLVALGGMVFTGLKTNTLEKDCHQGRDAQNNELPPDVASSYTMGGGTDGGHGASTCAKGGTYAKMSTGAGIAAGVFGGLALIAYYKGFVSKKESPNPTAGRSVRKKKQFAVTPIIAPDGAGATFRLDW